MIIGDSKLGSSRSAADNPCAGIGPDEKRLYVVEATASSRAGYHASYYVQ